LAVAGGIGLLLLRFTFWHFFHPISLLMLSRSPVDFQLRHSWIWALLAWISALALDLLSPAVTFDFCRNAAVAAAAVESVAVAEAVATSIADTAAAASGAANSTAPPPHLLAAPPPLPMVALAALAAA
jgi:hypothetical protein